MTNCNYCEKNHKNHVESQPIINILYKLTPEERMVILDYVKQYADDSYHSTIAESDIEDHWCKMCGHYNEKEDDGDRYIYLCSNMKCEIWK